MSFSTDLPILSSQIWKRVLGGLKFNSIVIEIEVVDRKIKTMYEDVIESHRDGLQLGQIFCPLTNIVS